VIDFGVTPATLIGLILPPPSCTRDACGEDWSFRGDSWHDWTVSLRPSTIAGQQGGTPREYLQRSPRRDANAAGVTREATVAPLT